MKLIDIIFESVVDLSEGPKSMTQDEFIKNVQIKHQNDTVTLSKGIVVPRYDFSKSIYKGSKQPITFYCNKIGKDGKPHGFQSISHASTMLSRGSGCKECKKDTTSLTLGHTKEKFIKNAEERWGKGTYDYNNLKYNGSEEPVDIICHKKKENGEEHGPFTINRAQWFINKKNPMYCPECTKLSERGRKILSQDDWLKKSRDLHKNKDGSPKYTYEYIENGITPYTGGRNKVIVTCPKHGPFKINKAESHLIAKSGCPKCATSKGEDAMVQYLFSLGYDTIKDKKFEDCNNLWKNKLTCNQYKFDAYSSELNTVFEFDGSMHFIMGSYKQTQEQFDSRALDDKYKNNYCLKNGIKLVRIGYLDKDDIKNQIDKSLKSKDMLWLSDNYPKSGWNK
jgi:hypothetical protein